MHTAKFNVPPIFPDVRYKAARLSLQPPKHSVTMAEARTVATDNRTISCSALPPLLKVKARVLFKVFTVCVPDGTKVEVSCRSKEGTKSPVENNTAVCHNNVATFPELRFMASSGRGVCVWCVCACVHVCVR